MIAMAHAASVERSLARVDMVEPHAAWAIGCCRGVAKRPALAAP